MDINSLGSESGASVAVSPKTNNANCGSNSIFQAAAFILSIILCLSMVFTFSFIVPCPARNPPQYSWNSTFPRAATYGFLELTDVNEDKVMDVIFVLKDVESRLNTTCVNAGLPVPCLFLYAVAGTDGATLWERPLQGEFHWAQCGLDGPSCLVSHADRLTAVSVHSGAIMWQELLLTVLQKSKQPVLVVPDLDVDGIGDLLLFGTSPAQTTVAILSGKTGKQIGRNVLLDAAMKHLLHTTAAGSHYVIFLTDAGLYGRALWKIIAKARAGSEVDLKWDPVWEQMPSDTSGFVQLYKSDSVQHVVLMGRGGTRPASLLLVTEGGVELIDGDSLRSLWSTNTSKVLSEPTFGHFNKDGTPDVVIEEDIGNGTKKVMILDGNSGKKLWEVHLRLRPNLPGPTSINTVKSFSIFIFWGGMLSKTNSTWPASGELFTCLLHPHYSNALLQKSRALDNIIAFKAVLLEQGHRASYIMLMNPAGEGALGTVTLLKHMLKEDIPESQILWLGDPRNGETDHEIREAFINLHFIQDT